MSDLARVVILDFGSQYTQLIARRVRELGVHSEIHPCITSASLPQFNNIDALILSGGPSSVLDSDRPEFDTNWLSKGVPVLGICYGMQLIAQLSGGDVKSSEHREYGYTELTAVSGSELFSGIDISRPLKVWMSHGDHVDSLPLGFVAAASSSKLKFAAMENPDRKLYALQYHPEVVHSEQGTAVLENFLFKIAKVSKNWNAKHFIETTIESIRNMVPEGAEVVCGLSGGVDSTVAAVLVHKAIGNRLHCLFVDNGLLRADEGDKVEAALGPKGFNLPFHRIDARDLFLSELAGVADPETKRKIIGRVFIEVFEKEARKFNNVKFLVQGTLYPDVIESVSPRGGPSVTIKSHHNVGGLPEKMALELIEPLRDLFKDEVRRFGEELGISRELLWRQPFPGPGLAVRILGPVSEERLSILRAADKIYLEEIRQAGLYDKLWQSFAVLLPVNTVGVMGDERTYENAVALRAVTSQDGMTADWYYLPQEVLVKVSNRIINEVKGINRVTFVISSKPPATIEWE